MLETQPCLCVFETFVIPIAFCDLISLACQWCKEKGDHSCQHVSIGLSGCVCIVRGVMLAVDVYIVEVFLRLDQWICFNLQISVLSICSPMFE